jgi:hypothetical protein
VALLQQLNADEALLGDLLEEFEARGSRAWFWRQAIAAAPSLILGRARRAEPHRRRAVNLAAAPRGSVAGGLGALAAAVLITVVAPQAWWLVAAGAAGGLVLAAVLAVGRRHAGPAAGLFGAADRASGRRDRPSA